MKKTTAFFGILLLTAFFCSCKEEVTLKPQADVQNKTLNKEMALAVMQKHLDAISSRNLEILESTLSPEGTMQLILPGTEIIEKTSGFLNYHREWFKTTNWTIDSRILSSKVGESIALTVVESTYKEPERDGKPYFNRMHVSYVLKKINGNWYVINDHMASVQKSTDTE